MSANTDAVKITAHQKFNAYTTIQSGRNRFNQAGWICECVCGKRRFIRESDLRHKTPISCGCTRREIGVSHGLYQHWLYETWRNMLRRCYDPKADSYPYYASHGIKVHKGWHDFREFIDYIESELGERPDGHTLDRPNNDRNYEPGNVRWASYRAQNNNTRGNVSLTFKGLTMTVRQWARKTGINHSTLENRINRGWPIPRALTEPVHRSCPVPEPA